MSLRHVPQTGGINLCGQSQAAQAINAKKGLNLTALQVGQQTGTADGSFTDFDELEAIFEHFGIRSPDAGHVRPATIAWHRAVLDAGGVAITLVDYRKLANKAPGHTGYRYAHFVTPVRIDGDTVWLHDPLRPNGPTEEPLASFTAAINSPSLYRVKVGETAEGNPIYEDRPNMPNQAFEVKNVVQTRNIGGVNLDLRNPVGKPDVSQLTGFGFVRFVYNVSNGTGSQDLNAAAALYTPYIQACIDAGITVILVVNHQTWGEERGFNWKEMDSGRWEAFGDGLAEMVERIARLYPGVDLIWQICNQQDAPPEIKDSFHIPPLDYNYIFNMVRAAIRLVTRRGKVITGGYVTGPGGGMAHFNASMINPDGVAFHPYLASAGGHYPYLNVPSINVQIAEWRKLGRPLWISEFSILDRFEEPSSKVAQYAAAFLQAVGDTPSIWYAWRDGMHNGYGVAQANGTVRADLKDALTSAAGVPTTPQPGTQQRVYLPVTGLKAGWILNVRMQPKLGATVIAQIANGSRIKPLDEIQDDGTNVWAEIELSDGKIGWTSTNAAGELSVKL